MKFTITLVAALAFLSFITISDTISKKERNNAAKFLEDSEKNALNTAGKLSEAQLKYKVAPDQWSVEECMMHIAVTENALWGMVEGSMSQPANPQNRADIKWTDDDVMKNIASRERKVKTYPPLEPQNSGFKTVAEAETAFKASRGKLIEYVKKTDADLRNHVSKLEIGSFDAYQMILFIGAHSNRHVAQMKEVMADPGFPKN